MEMLEEEYVIEPSFTFVAVSGKEGFFFKEEQAWEVEGELYIQVLRVLSLQPASVMKLAEFTRQPLPYILHAVKVLGSANYIVSRQSLAHTFVHRSLLKLPPLNWAQCTPGKIPEVSLINDLGSDEAQERYRQAIGQGKAWLPVIYGNGCCFIGPVFDPSAGPCPACVGFLVKKNLNVQSWAERNEEYIISSAQYYSSSQVAAMNKALTALAGKWDSCNDSRQILISVNAEGKESIHIIRRRPECPQCGDPSMLRRQMEAPLALSGVSSSDGKNHDYKYGYRSVTPQTTWDRLKHHIDPVTGVLSRFRRIGGAEDIFLHVYGAVYPVIPMKARPRPQEFYLSAFGKGISAAASEVSALCEAIERASLHYHGDEPVVHAQQEELNGLAVAPLSIQHFHPQQLQLADATHALGAVPRAVKKNEALNWLPAWSLRDNERRYIPLDAVLYGHPKAEQDRVAVFESNGLSAGNTIEEAIGQGLLELIERDAVAIWWFNRLQRPAFDTRVMQADTWFSEALAQLCNQDWEVSFLDLTIDTGVFVVCAVGKHEEGFLTGYGCHPDARLALNRALTELIQVKALMKPVKPPEGYEDVGYLYPSPEAKKFEPLPFAPGASGGISDMIQKLVSHLAALGLDTIVLNCTRPYIGFPVVKVICPGLRAFRPRFGEGRLYDVPVALGLLQQRKTYVELNPLWLTIEPFRQVQVQVEQ